MFNKTGCFCPAGKERGADWREQVVAKTNCPKFSLPMPYLIEAKSIFSLAVNSLWQKTEISISILGLGRKQGILLVFVFRTLKSGSLKPLLRRLPRLIIYILPSPFEPQGWGNKIKGFCDLNRVGLRRQN